MRRSLLALLMLAGCLSGQAIRQNQGFKASSIPANDDGSGPLTSLGFTINFFGKMRSTGWVNNNGNITFDSPLSTYTPFGLESTQREIVAAFFADVDTRPPGSALVTYGTDSVNGRPAFGANYLNVGYYNSRADKLNRFQIVLIERSDTGDGNFDIEFNYERISWETGEASGGINGYGGVSAAMGWSNGSGNEGTSFELDGSFVPGSFLDSSRRSLSRGRYNSTVTGRWLFRARGGQVLQPLQILTGCPLPQATVGGAYLQRLAAFGGGSTYRWSMAADPGSTLPAGMTLASDGTLSGTPSALGTTEFTLRVATTTEDGEQTESRRCSLTVAPPSLVITTACPLPPATVGQPYSRSIVVSGGRPPFRWSLAPESAPLPPGLALTSAGMISGSATAAGTSVVTLMVNSNDADGANPATKTCTLTVNPSVLNLTSSCSLPPATAGVPYAQELAVSGGVAPYRWSAVGNLPFGLSLTPEGRLEGVPSSASSTSFRVRVNDARFNVVEQTCSLTIDQPQIQIDTACPLPNGLTGQPYSQSLRASGGAPPYIWSMTGGLPAGVTLSGDGTLSGNPGSAGANGFRVIVTDSEGRAGAKGCNLTVLRADYSLASCPLPQGTVGVDYSQRLVVEGGLSPYFFSATGALPNGLTLTSSGLMTGRPREAGAFPISIRVLDANGRSTAQPCPITVRPSGMEIAAACPLPKAAVGMPYLERFTVSGGVPPYRFRLDGRLPAGLELSSDGVVRGTPLAPGSESFEVEVTDANSRLASKACSVESALPSLPSLRLAGVPSTVAPATAGPAITLELAQSYPLPLKGELVLTAAADTGVNDDAVNRPDPIVRFANGRRVFPFTIAPGSRQVSTTVASTGTVAAVVTAAVANLQVAGVHLLATPPPRQFRIARSAPVLSDACYLQTAEGISAVITGSSTTRQIQSASFDYTATTGPRAEQKNTTLDVSGYSYDYFSKDESVRTGGAFTMTIPVASGSLEVTAMSVSITNSVGSSATRTMQRCR